MMKKLGVGWKHSNLDDDLEAFSKLGLDVLWSTLLLKHNDHLYSYKTGFGQQNVPERKLMIFEYLSLIIDYLLQFDICDPPKHWKLPRTMMANLAGIVVSIKCQSSGTEK